MAACKITILTDNLPCTSHAALLCEHGLSMLVEVGRWRMLCDMGASSAYAVNAAQLDIDLQGVDTAFLSHAHNDHTGGLRHFLDTFPDIPVCLSASAKGLQCYSSRREMLRDISIDNELLTSYPERFHWIADSCWIHPSVALVKSCSGAYPLPHGNRFLTAQRGVQCGLDDFAHELSVAITTTQGLVVLSSCSHRGVLNIIQDCIRFTGEARLSCFVGGLHLVDMPGVEEEAQQLAIEFTRRYPQAEIHTGHCTCDKAKEALLAHLSNARIFTTGTVIEIAG
ncbi:MAG: MBL fold metallo-hydrolase [Bacteroides sp.]|nr:MBL fold metallo-hydrolase [Bacteroides sp.]